MIQDVIGEKALTVRLEPDVYRRVERLAKREKRSMSAQIAYLVEQALAALPAQQLADLETRSKALAPPVASPSTKKPRRR